MNSMGPNIIASNASARAHYEYDVAFSFRGPNRRHAQDIRSHLSSDLRVFIDEERPEDVLLRPGNEAFAEIYGRTARLVVVIYSEDWGRRGFTQFEKEAIEGRLLRDGSEFLKYVLPPRTSTEVPAGLPPLHLWLDLGKLGPSKAATIIEHRVRELPGETRELNTVERARRHAEAKRVEQRKREFLSGPDGLGAARAQFVEVRHLVEGQIAEVNADQRHSKYELRAMLDMQYDIARDGHSVRVRWRAIQQQLDGSVLRVMVWRPDLACDVMANDRRDDYVMPHRDFTFQVDDELAPRWKSDSRGREWLLTTRGLADWIMEVVIAGEEGLQARC